MHVGKRLDPHLLAQLLVLVVVDLREVDSARTSHVAELRRSLLILALDLFAGSAKGGVELHHHQPVRLRRHQQILQVALACDILRVRANYGGHRKRSMTIQMYKSNNTIQLTSHKYITLAGKCCSTRERFLPFLCFLRMFRNFANKQARFAYRSHSRYFRHNLSVLQLPHWKTRKKKRNVKEKQEQETTVGLALNLTVFI